MRLPASIAWTCPLRTRIESPAATETLLTQRPRRSRRRGPSRRPRGSRPRLSPTKSEAPGAECATYQFSVLGSPPSSFATAAGGCTCRLSLSEQSSHLTSSGKGAGRGPARAHDLGRMALDQLAQGRPAEGAPPARRDWASGLSTISQLSPIGGPGGSSPAKEGLEPAAAPDALLVNRLELKNFSHEGRYRDYCKKGREGFTIDRVGC